MTTPLKIEITNVDTEPWLNDVAMTLLFGVSRSDIKALPVADGNMRIPAEWTRRGRRRAREAMAATGSDFILDILQHWAQKDHGCDIEVVYL